MEEPRWLSDDEQHAWRQLAAVVLKLPAALEAQLQRDARMSHFEYWVIPRRSSVSAPAAYVGERLDQGAPERYIQLHG